MSHRDVNPASVAHPKRVAIVISDSSESTTAGWPVGFWWSGSPTPAASSRSVGYHLEVYDPSSGRCEAHAMGNPEDDRQWGPEDVISRGDLPDPAGRGSRSATH